MKKEEGSVASLSYIIYICRILSNGERGRVNLIRFLHYGRNDIACAKLVLVGWYGIFSFLKKLHILSNCVFDIIKVISTAAEKSNPFNLMRLLDYARSDHIWFVNNQTLSKFDQAKRVEKPQPLNK